MISIGTDCSGIEAPIEALKQLGILFQHKWACEIDSFARKSILANYEPEILYEDIIQRDHSQLPDVDMYVCGFPCQPFSLMGKKQGTKDSRANIMLHCIEVIKLKTPNMFILENVKNFKFMEKGEPFSFLIGQLESLNIYSIYQDIYNTKDYGIPQNRERLYIIGIRKDIQKKKFNKPKPIEMKKLDDFILDKTIYPFNMLDKKLIENIDRLKKNNPENIDCIVTPFTYYYPIIGICPTLTTQCSRFFIYKKNRKITIKEALKLQGFNWFNQVVSNSQMYKQIGNSMSVNVLKSIYTELFAVLNI